MTEDEIDLLTTEELVSALRRRTTSALIGLVGDRTETTESRELWWSGGPFSAIGLAEWSRQKLLAELMNPDLRRDWDHRGDA